MFRESDIGLPKVEVARQRVLEINPEIQIQAIHSDLEFGLGIGDVRAHDVIIGCLDSVNARYYINQLAYRAGIPWINGGIGVAEGEVSFLTPIQKQLVTSVAFLTKCGNDVTSATLVKV